MRSNPFEDAIARVRDRVGCLGATIVYHPTTGSTNDAAADVVARRSADAFALREEARPRSAKRSGERNAEPSVEGLVVVADEQTAGRGRRGHTWFSPPGSGLYVSVVLTPGRARVDPDRATTLLTLAAGVAIAEGIESASGLRVDLKWPNDLFVGRRKLGGILAEGHDLRRPVPDIPERAGARASGAAVGPRTMRVVVLGYGINVGTAAYPPQIADRATSLETELGRAVDRHLVFAETLTSLARRYDDLLDGRFDAILDAWRRRAPSATGARVTWTTNAGPRTGVAQGIDPDGALLVRTGEGVDRIVSGEITWDI